MGDLTEVEIFDCLETNFRLAAECCEALAVLPRKGSTYDALRNKLLLIEGACRQAAAWRGDSRWLPMGLQMAACHKLAGEWLRGIKQPDGSRRRLNEGEIHPLFKKLAEVLRQGQKAARDLKTKRTNRVGIILPAMMPAPHRDTRPVHISVPLHLRPSGLIVPT